MLEIFFGEMGTKYLDIQSEMFRTMKSNRVDLISCPSGFLGWVQPLRGKSAVSSVISHPYGINSLQLKLHELIESQRKSCDIIDIVINQNLVMNEDFKQIEKEMAALIAVCDKNGLQIRAVLEYRLFGLELTFELCSSLRKLHVYEVITNSGRIIDDFTDNLILSQELNQKMGMSPIITFYAPTVHQIELATECGISNFRFVNTQWLGDKDLAEKVYSNSRKTL